MEKRVVRTIVTYNIQKDARYEDEARKALKTFLQDLKYEEGGDQSTMTHPRRVAKLTLKGINDLCNQVKFNKGDRVTIYRVEKLKDNTYGIVKRTFNYNPEENCFQ